MKNLLGILSLSMLALVFGCNTPIKENDTIKSQDMGKEDALAKQSKETMEIASKFMDAMGKGDMETMISLMDDNMVWQNEGDKKMPWIGPWKGKEKILKTFLPLFGENFKTTKWVTEDAFSSGDVAAFFGRMKGITLKSNQETTEFTFALRVKVSNGKIVLWNWLEDSFAVSQSFHSNKN